MCLLPHFKKQKNSPRSLPISTFPSKRETRGGWGKDEGEELPLSILFQGFTARIISTNKNKDRKCVGCYFMLIVRIFSNWGNV